MATAAVSVSWGIKSAAAAAAALGAARARRPRGGGRAHPVGAAWFGCFFASGAASAAIGAALEARDAEGSGVLWSLMVLMVALAGALAAGAGGFCVAASRRCDARGRATFRAIAALAGASALAEGVWLLSKAPSLPFDTASYFAAPGALVLMYGAARCRSGWLLLGSLVPVVGYALAASDVLPLPAWLSTDGLYHSTLLLGYLMLGEGAARVTSLSAALGGADKVGGLEALLASEDAAETTAETAAPRELWACEGLLLRVHSIILWIITELPPGARRFRVKHAINLHKACCTAAVAALMLANGDGSEAAYVYLAMHGSYGLTWLLKDRTFPDASWEMPATAASAAALWCLMGLFWIAPALLTACERKPAAPVLGLAVGMYALGMFLLHSSDSQKHWTLKYRPGSLMTEGLWGSTRNPNYLGEVFIYSAFACMAYRSEWWWMPWCVNATVWAVLFVPNWLVKDRSLARYGGFRAYEASSGVLLPWLLGDGWWPTGVSH